MNIQQLLDLTVQKNASDLHLVIGFPPIIRIHGELVPVAGEEILTEQQIEAVIKEVTSASQLTKFDTTWELDFSFDFLGKARFRGNLYKQKDTPAAEFRLIPNTIPLLEDLGLPPVLKKLTTLRQGFVLITGPTGHGKSTTLASLINVINNERAANILTIEDPIEYSYPKGKSLISQRELENDTHSWSASLRAALREDPDVVLVGEMRDLETISSAITIAETGHLVFSTLHTNSAAQSIDRIIDVFPQNQQPQIRLQLAATLEAVISQRLVPTITPGRTAVAEVLLVTPA
ncbi:type IV pili twitching motility protein PilT, partial [Candidatus Daviesbacteria bacterium RIFCSPLOWO2_02_FULL_36_7]